MCSNNLTSNVWLIRVIQIHAPDTENKLLHALWYDIPEQQTTCCMHIHNTHTHAFTCMLVCVPHRPVKGVTDLNTQDGAPWRLD